MYCIGKHKIEKTTIRSVLWILLILNMSAIFVLSGQAAEISTVESDVFVAIPKQIYEKNHPELADSEISYLRIQFIVRKTAHMLEFAALSVWATGLLILYKMRMPELIAVFFSSIYGASDEIHQMFVPGREGKFTDWCFDTCGAILGAILVWLLLLILNKYIRNVETKPVAEIVESGGGEGDPP